MTDAQKAEYNRQVKGASQLSIFDALNSYLENRLPMTDLMGFTGCTFAGTAFFFILNGKAGVHPAIQKVNSNSLFSTKRRVLYV